MPIDVAPMWDFKHPEVSEQRFRSALQGAVGDDALILQTQLARTFGIRKDFATARELLKNIEPAIATAGAEARVRYQLELGRTYASATHAPELLTDDAKARARAAYNEALRTAQAAHLDGLAIDAIHMLGFVDTSPADQLKWAQEALAVVEASTQADAKKWEASIRNNVGYALHQLGRYDEALQQFNAAVTLRERGSDANATRVAYWMVAWTLRAMKRNDEALQIQLRLEREADAAGDADPYVFEELETLYREAGNAERAEFYANRKRTAAE
jgi:tetratricopeptide (TPR) repeat protein